MTFEPPADHTEAPWVGGLASTAEPHTKDPPAYLDLDLIRDIYFFAMACIIPVGLVCNLLSITVFLASPSLKQTTTGHFLIALSGADFTFLLGELFRWMSTSPGRYPFDGPDFVNTSLAGCWVVFIGRYTAKMISAWIIVAITLERFVTVQFPLRVSRISTLRRARLLILAIIVAAIALNLFPFWTLGLKPHNGIIYCQVTRRAPYERWSMVSLRFGTLFIPFVLIITLTLLIIWNLSRARRHRRRHLVGQQHHAISSVQRQLTLMLLAVSINFLIIRLPYTIAYYLNHNKKTIWVPLSVRHSNNLFAAWRMTDVLATSNYCLNFFLYCLCGSVFRRQLLLLLRCFRPDSNLQRTRISLMSSSNESGGHKLTKTNHKGTRHSPASSSNGSPAQRAAEVFLQDTQAPLKSNSNEAVGKASTLTYL